MKLLRYAFSQNGLIVMKGRGMKKDRRIRQYDEADKALPDDLEADRRRVRYTYSPFHIAPRNPARDKEME